MKANTFNPSEIFGNNIRYVVPLYQRPYVWTKADQWEPLWEDVRTLAERVLNHTGGYGAAPVSPHFLGAIVLDQQLNAVNVIQSRAVIDGQQRLTTLQLLLDAAQSVVARLGTPIASESLRVLVLNNPALVTEPDHVFKVWPTGRDQAAFRAAMHDDLVPDTEQAVTGIAKAHAYFAAAVEAWATEESDRSTEDRLGALAEALRAHLRLVVIDLEPGDNAQVIFETLNHRGAPLLAADLIKNLVFQLAELKGLDTAALYAKYWKELDSDYWRRVVAQGRLFRPQIDVFMHRWLTMTLRREVKADRVFTDFRDSVMLVDGVDVEEVLRTLSTDAAVYRAWETLAPESVAGRFRYRVLQALDSQIFAPLFLWLTRYPPSVMPVEQQEKALRGIESWVVRRSLSRVTSKDYNNLVVDLLGALEDAGPAVAGDTVEAFLAATGAESRFWPSDERVRTTMRVERVYTSMTRARVRMLLEALEDAARTDLGEGQIAPRNLTIEHVMPQGWRDYWNDGTADDPKAADQRDALVHTLGNLSLVTGRLNPTLSNRPWSDAEAITQHLGAKGKRDYLLQHSNLKLNAQLVYDNSEAWTENAIRERTDHLIDLLLSIWPAPSGAAQPQEVRRGQAEVDVDQLELPAVDWPNDDEAITDAQTLWQLVSPVGAKLMTILLSVSPERIGADDLAEALEIDSGARGVAGVLSGIAAKAAVMGRSLPVTWQEGEPSTYWIESAAAATLIAGRHGITVSSAGAQTARTRTNKIGDLNGLLDAGLIEAGDQVVHQRPTTGETFTGTITETGEISTDRGTFDSPSRALSELLGNNRNGWTDWSHVRSGKTLAMLRNGISR